MTHDNRGHCWCGPVSLLLVTSFLLAACAWPPQPPPTATATGELRATVTKAPVPTVEPSATDTNSEVGEMKVCYVFVAEYEEQLGGMPALLEVAYIARDGTIQQTSEGTDDTILSLREGKGDVFAILQSLAGMEFPSPPEPEKETEPTGEAVVLPEHAGPTLLIEVAFCDAPAKKWVGSVEDVPSALAEAVDNAKALGQMVPVQPIHPGQRYIRAQALQSEQVEQLQRAGLVLDIDSGQLESSPLLDDAIGHERRLIGLPEEDEALYGEIPLSFTHAQSAHVSLNERVYQIRHLLAVEP